MSLIRRKTDQRGDHYDFRHLTRKELFILKAGVSAINVALAIKSQPTSDDYENRQLSHKLLHTINEALLLS